MSEDYAEFLLEAARSSNAAFHEFRLQHEATKAQVHAFVEGGDDALVYGAEVRRRAGDRDVYLYVCGRKRDVIEVRQSVIAEAYPTDCALFFVDRDFDELLGWPDVVDDVTFQTDGYSVESEFVTPLAIAILFTDIVGFTNGSGAYRRSMAVMEEMTRTLPRHAYLFCGWMLSAMELGLKCNINNVDLGRIFHVEDSGAITRQKGAAAHFARSTGLNTAIIPLPVIRNSIRKLRDAGPERGIRGKLFAWIVCKAATKAVEAERIAGSLAHGRVVRVPVPLRQNELVFLLAGRIPTPAHLTDFLDRRLI